MFNIYLAPPRALEPQGVSAFIKYKMPIYQVQNANLSRLIFFVVFLRKKWYYKDNENREVFI